VKAETAEAPPVEKRKHQHQAPATTNEKVWREVVSWFWVIIAFLLIEGTMVQARVIPSGSMEDTVLIGDHLIVSRFGFDAGIPFTDWHVPLWRNPKRQQIIVFRAPLPEEGNPDFIKRCIGLPGDHVKIVEGAVYVNDVRLLEPYTKHAFGSDSTPVENYPPTSILMLDGGLTREWSEDFPNHVVNGELVVPPGEYFMMGDNRDNSRDSRFWGFVPRANIIGTPLLIYMSIDAPNPDEVWGPGFAVERFEAYASVFIHPSRVRWKRLFHTL
jgi:signal peptidase I